MKRVLRFAILCVLGIAFLLPAQPAFAIKNLVRGGRLLRFFPKTHPRDMRSAAKRTQIRGDIGRAAYIARAAERNTHAYVRRVDAISEVAVATTPVAGAEPIPDLSVPVEISPEQPISFLTKEKIDGVIFDFDGVLVDSLPAWEHSASNFLRRLGITPPPGLDDELSKLSLSEGAQILKDRFDLPQTPDEIIELTLAPIWEHYRTDIPAKPGALELLASLHAQGIKIGIATGGDRRLVLQALTRLGMRRYIQAITTCDEVGVGKQNSAVYDVTRAKLGVEASRALVIEDALFALQTAKSAGYITAGVAEPNYPVDHARAMRTAGHYFIYSLADGVIWPN